MSQRAKVTIKNPKFATKKLNELTKGSTSMDAGYLEGSNYIDGTSVAQAALDNEFGYTIGNIHVPARPAMRDTVRLKEKDWAKQVVSLMTRLQDTEKTLGLLGEIVVADIKEVIKSGDFTPNAASTIEKKGHDSPLQDTGARQQATAYRVNTSAKS